MIDALVAVILSAVSNLETPDPIRYCYTIEPGKPMPDNGVGTINQPWNCYLAADRPRYYVPVFVGPQSQIRKAS